MTLYYQVDFLDEGLLRFESTLYGKQLFSLRKLRKPAVCESCGDFIAKGEQAWAEATSSSLNRMHRIHPRCVKLKETV